MTEPTQLTPSLDRAAPTASHGHRSIEADFPILEISRLAQVESYRKNIYRPAYYIHKWWARRTGATFRAILPGQCDVQCMTSKSIRVAAPTH